MNKNTTRKVNREIQINSDFWRAVTKQACINNALSKGIKPIIGQRINFPKPREVV